MADTVFQDNVASASNLVYAAWLNDQNNLTYRGIDPKYATTTGTANAQVLTISAMSSTATLTAGMTFTFKVGALLTNTAATVLTINSFAATSVTNFDGSALRAGQMTAGQIVTVSYDGTQYQLLTAMNSGVFGPGSFTTISASGQITSTLATGTAPFVIASTTAVANLNASLLLGSTWAAPAAIGSGTPAAGTFTALTGTSGTLNGSFAAGGTWTAAATWTLPALTLGGTVSGGGNQINNVVIGDSTPLAGTFTTATANAFVPNSASVPTNGMYLPAANTVGWAINSAEKMRLDANGGLGLGVTPNVLATKTQFNVGGVGMGLTYSSLGSLHITNNSYDVSGVQKYANTAPAGLLYISDNTFALLNAPSGTAGNSISWTTVMQSAANGRMAINGTPTTAQLFISAGASGISVVSMESTSSSPSSSDAVCTMWNKATSGDNKFLSFYTEGSATERGLIDYNRGGGVTRYNTSSDMTLKTLIGDAPAAKSKEILSGTPLREYYWNDDATQKPQIGVFAQELYPVFKGAVSVGGYKDVFDGDGNVTGQRYVPWAVDKTAFTFHLVAGWQDHESRLTQDRTDIDAIKLKLGIA